MPEQSYPHVIKWACIANINKNMQTMTNSQAIHVASLHFGPHARTIKRWIIQLRKFGTLERKPGSERLFKFTAEQEWAIHVLALDEPELSHTSFITRLNLNCHECTVSRSLKRIGLFRRVARE